MASPLAPSDAELLPAPTDMALARESCQPRRCIAGAKGGGLFKPVKLSPRTALNGRAVLPKISPPHTSSPVPAVVPLPSQPKSLMSMASMPVGAAVVPQCDGVRLFAPTELLSLPPDVPHERMPRRPLDEAVDGHGPAIAAARVARLDSRRARVEADDVRFCVGHALQRQSPAPSDYDPMKHRPPCARGRAEKPKGPLASPAVGDAVGDADGYADSPAADVICVQPLQAAAVLPLQRPRGRPPQPAVHKESQSPPAAAAAARASPVPNSGIDELLIGHRRAGLPRATRPEWPLAGFYDKPDLCQLAVFAVSAATGRSASPSLSPLRPHQRVSPSPSGRHQPLGAKVQQVPNWAIAEANAEADPAARCTLHLARCTLHVASCDDSAPVADAIGVLPLPPLQRPRGQPPQPSMRNAPVPKAAVTKAHSAGYPDADIAAAPTEAAVAVAQADIAAAPTEAQQDSACANMESNTVPSRAALTPIDQTGTAKLTRLADSKSAKKRAKRDPAAASGSQPWLAKDALRGPVAGEEGARLGDSLRFRSQLLQCSQERRTNQSDLDGWGDEW